MALFDTHVIPIIYFRSAMKYLFASSESFFH